MKKDKDIKRIESKKEKYDAIKVIKIKEPEMKEVKTLPKVKEVRKKISPIIASELKALRISRNYSQATLADMLGFSSMHISLIENAKRLPSVEVVEAYAEHFDMDVEKLLNLRELTIYETVDIWGDETPLAIKNERNMLMHANRSVGETPEKITVKFTIDKDGTIRLNGEEIDADKIPRVLKDIRDNFTEK